MKTQLEAPKTAKDASSSAMDISKEADASKPAEASKAEAPKAPREYDVEKVAKAAAMMVYSDIPGLNLEELMQSGVKKPAGKCEKGSGS